MIEEFLDVVDEDSEIIGQESRRVVHQTGLWHRGVHVFLFAPDGRLLVQKRSKAQDTYPGALDCSVSEHLKVGESYQDGAIRGLHEELGIEPIQLHRLVRFKMNYGPNDNEFCELYEGVYDDEPLIINHNEIEWVAIYTIPELEEMAASEPKSFASWFIQLLRWYTGKPADMKIIMAG